MNIHRMAQFSLALLLLAIPSPAEDQPSPRDALVANVNDKAALDSYMRDLIRRFNAAQRQDSKRASGILSRANSTLAQLKPTNPIAGQRLDAARKLVARYEKRLRLQTVPLQTLLGAIAANPGDEATLNDLWLTGSSELTAAAVEDPAEARRDLDAIVVALTTVRNNASDESIARRLDSRIRMFGRLGARISANEKSISMVGRQAPALKFDHWITKRPSKMDEKVKLVQFWSLQSPSSIAYQSQLHHWQNEFGKDALCVISVSRLEDLMWRERRPARTPNATNEEELSSLKQFVSDQKLGHSFATMESSTLHEFFHVHSAPHVVILDESNRIVSVHIGLARAHLERIRSTITDLLADRR